MLVETLFGDRDLVAVADGMGGHAGGEIASEKALETLLAYLESSNDLAAGVKQANLALLRAADDNPQWKGMGTTLVALLRVDEEYYVANVGDSRAYRLDDTGIRQITADHSFTAEAVSSGRLSEDEAERSPWRNALTRAVGTDEEVHVDVFGPFAVEPPHVVVMCTDGLYRVMSDVELADEVQGRGDQADTARNLVADALRRGSNDNISVAVVEFGQPAPSGPDRPSSPSAEGTVTELARPESPVLPVGAQDPETDSEGFGPEPGAAGARAAAEDAAVGGGAAESATTADIVDEGGGDGDTSVAEVADEGAAVAEAAARADGDAKGAETDEGEAPASDADATPTRGPVADRENVVGADDVSSRAEGTGGRRAAEGSGRSSDPSAPTTGSLEAPASDTTASVTATTPTGPAATVEPVEPHGPATRAARAAPPRGRTAPRARGRRGRMPAWVKREFIPAVLLIAVTLILVFVISSMVG